jgi:hypothetical protein
MSSSSSEEHDITTARASDSRSEELRDWVRDSTGRIIWARVAEIYIQGQDLPSMRVLARSLNLNENTLKDMANRQRWSEKRKIWNQQISQHVMEKTAEDSAAFMRMNYDWWTRVSMNLANIIQRCITNLDVDNINDLVKLAKLKFEIDEQYRYPGYNRIQYQGMFAKKPTTDQDISQAKPAQKLLEELEAMRAKFDNTRQN